MRRIWRFPPSSGGRPIESSSGVAEDPGKGGGPNHLEGRTFPVAGKGLLLGLGKYLED
jgi:hypothetical protein